MSKISNNIEEEKEEDDDKEEIEKKKGKDRERCLTHLTPPARER